MRPNILLVTLFTCFLPSPQGRAGNITPAITPELIDLENSLAFPGSPIGDSQRDILLAATSAKPQTGWYPPWSTAPSLEKARHLRLAFKQPLEIGTILGAAGTISILKPDAPFPGDVTQNDHWRIVGEAGAAAHVLEPGTRIRALRFTSRLPATPPELSSFQLYNLLLLKERFYTPLLHGASHREPGTKTQRERHIYFWDTSAPVAALAVAQQRAGLLKVDALKDRFRGHPVTADDRDWREMAEAQGEFCSMRAIPLEGADAVRAIRVRVFKDSREASFSICLPLAALGDRPPPAARPSEILPPFHIEADLPREGFLAMRIEEADGRRVRNLVAEVERDKGKLQEPWDLKDEKGRFVSPGEYRWKGILMDPIRLTYETTVYNGGKPAWWAAVPSGGGWLADHCAPQSAAAFGEKVFIGTFLAESGHTLAALDAEGNKLWGAFNFGAWAGAPELASDDRFVYIASVPAGDASITVFVLDPNTYKSRPIYHQGYNLEIPGGLTGAAAAHGKLYLAHSGRPAPWIRSGLNPGNVDFDRCSPPVAEGAKPDHPQVYSNREVFLSALRAGLPHNHQVRWTGPPAKNPRAEMIIVFRQPQPIGSVVLPAIDVKLSVLKSGRPLPAGPALVGAGAGMDEKKEEETGEDTEFDEAVEDASSKDWEDFRGKSVPGNPVGVIAAPEEAVTSALKLTFTRPGGDSNWSPVLPWMMILKKRFRNIAPEAVFASPHGRVSECGSISVSSREDITPANPVLLALKWDKPRQVRGIGLIGLTSGRCEVDVFQGESDASPFDFMESDRHWKHAGGTSPYLEGKAWAQCLHPDMHVDFGESLAVRAIRCRLVEGTRGDKGNARLASLAAVLVYEPAGGDPPEPPSLHQRVTVLELPKDDSAEAKLLAHAPAQVTGGIAASPSGDLYAVTGKQVVRLKFSGEKAEARPVVTEGLTAPQGLAIDRDGNFYVSDFQTHNIQVFTPEGKLLRALGKPGGRQMGPYDPERMIHPRRMAINSRGHLWVAESDYQPKKVSAWSLDGKLITWKLGPSQYGGGGWMDPEDRRIVRYAGMEFQIDWDTGDWRLANIIYSAGLPGTVAAGNADRTLRREGVTYVVADIGYQTSPVSLVTRYDEARGLCVPLVAAGPAAAWGDFQKPDIQKKFGKTNLGPYSFLWMDENNDGESQPEEVHLSQPGVRLTGAYWGSRIGDDLALCFTDSILKPTRFQAGGAPVYDLEKLEKRPGGISWRTADGRTFVIGNQFYDSQGKLAWEYTDHYLSVHGSHVAPRPRPAGMLVGEHAVVGHFQAGNEEFFVTNGNHGDWFAFTADGFLAATLFGGPQGYGQRYWRFPQCHRGLDISDVRLDEEHFFGSITRADDGKIYAVAGHNHCSIVRVDGLENMLRLEGQVLVSPRDVAEVEKYLIAQQMERRQRNPAFARIQQVARPREIDGKDSEWPTDAFFTVDEKWNHLSKKMDTLIDAGLAYDNQNLYLIVRINNDSSAARNAAQEEKLLFKGGDAVDLQIRTDIALAGNPQDAQPGDVRILCGHFQGKPIAILYRYRVPGTPEEKAHRFASPWRHVLVDEVGLIADSEVAWAGGERGYVLEAKLPLSRLGFKLYPGVRFRGEVGVLYSDDAGLTTVNRVYWSNKANHITSDIPSEVQIHPGTWGHFLCVGKSEMDVGAQAAEMLNMGETRDSGEVADDIVEDELEKEGD